MGVEEWLVSSGEFLCGFDAGGELLALFGEGAEVALDLEAVPEGIGLAKESAETDSRARARRDAAR